MIKVIFTLFNLQGTALCRRPCADSVILPHSPPFVKNFFRGFSRNFHAPLLGRILRFSQQFHPNFIGLCRFLLPLSRALGYTIIPFPICQLLFSGFFKKVFGRTRCHFQVCSAPCSQGASVSPIHAKTPPLRAAFIGSSDLILIGDRVAELVCFVIVFLVLHIQNAVNIIVLCFNFACGVSP